MLRFALVPTLFLVGLTSACAGAGQLPRSSASEQCSTGTAALLDLQVRPVALPTAVQGLDVSDGRGTIRPATAFAVEGPCGKHIARFEQGNVYIPPSVVGQLTAGNRITVVELPYRAPAITATERHPALAGGQFQMADRVDARRSDGRLTETFIGLWSTPTGATLGSFTRYPDGSFSPVTEEMRSVFPIRGVSYFPSLHGGTGQLGLVSLREGGVWLTSIDWGHPRL